MGREDQGEEMSLACSDEDYLSCHCHAESFSASCKSSNGLWASFCCFILPVALSPQNEGIEHRKRAASVSSLSTHKERLRVVLDLTGWKNIARWPRRVNRIE